MDRSSEMPGKRVLRGCLVQQLAALNQFGQFGSDFLPIPPQLIEQASGDVLGRAQSSPCGDQTLPRGVLRRGFHSEMSLAVTGIIVMSSSCSYTQNNRRPSAVSPQQHGRPVDRLKPTRSGFETTSSNSCWLTPCSAK
jgi:hypothetical protein